MIFSKTCVHHHLLHHDDRRRHETAGPLMQPQEQNGVSQPLMAEFMTALPHINEQSFLPTSSITRSGAAQTAGSPSSSLDMISGPPPTSSANNVSHALHSMIKIEDPLTPSLSPPTDPGTPGQADFAWMKEKKSGRKQNAGKKGASPPPVTPDSPRLAIFLLICRFASS